MSAHVWTTGDDRRLREMCARSLPLWEMAMRIGASERTVSAAMDRLGLPRDFGRRYKPGELGAIAYAAGMTDETWASIDARLQCPHGGAQAAAKRYQRRHGLPALPSKAIVDTCPPEVEPLLGTMLDTVLARRLRRPTNTIRSWRVRRGIPAYGGTWWARRGVADDVARAAK